MRFLFVFTLLLFLLTGCKKNDLMVYNDPPTIYFEGERDIDFTFSKYRTDEVTIFIPVEIGGYKNSVNREINLQIVADSTTAIEGKHYKILMNKVLMPADSFKVNIPIILFDSDSSLKTKGVRLYLRLIPNEPFPTPFYEKQDLSITMSDILLKPKLWDDVYSRFFGVYSQAKHRKILEIADIPEIPDVYDGGSYNYKWDAFGRAVNNYYKENYPQYDENNQVIEPWM